MELAMIGCRIGKKIKETARRRRSIQERQRRLRAAPLPGLLSSRARIDTAFSVLLIA